MQKMVLLAAAAVHALALAQAAPGSQQLQADREGGAPITSFAQLPLSEATAARCGIAFASVRQWQASGDPRGKSWPDMSETRAREFFVRSMAQIMEAHDLDRPAISQLVQEEVESHLADEGAAIEAMMPGCLLALEASGL